MVDVAGRIQDPFLRLRQWRLRLVEGCGLRGGSRPPAELGEEQLQIPLISRAER